MPDAHKRRSFSVISLIAVAALLGSIASCAPLAKIIYHGGQRQLRTNPHPAPPGPKLIVFAMDGAGYNQFMQAAHSGKAPHIAALFGAQQGPNVYAHAYSIPNALAVLPTTLPGWTAIFTGLPPAYNGIPGDEFFLRERNQFYAPVPVSVKDPDDTLMMLSADLLGKLIESPTVFEQLGLKAYVSLNGVYRGADVFTAINRADWAGMLATLARETVTGSYANRALFAKIDTDSISAVIANIGKNGFPDLQVIYFPGIDLFTHRARNPLPDQVKYIEDITDKCVGRIIDYYAQHGMMRNTYVMFISDHGHTPVLPDDKHALSNDDDHNLQRLLEKAGFRVRPSSLHVADRDYQAVTASQGVMAYIYLADRSGCRKTGQPCDWKKPPRLKRDVMPVVRALFNSNRFGRPIPRFKHTLDLIFARKGAPPGHDAGVFEIYNGRKLVPIYEYLWKHPRPDLIDLDLRMIW
ncbi:MAG: alkaline phosphatase family protein, partial [Candidatus Binataceae bacterium]